MGLRILTIKTVLLFLLFSAGAEFLQLNNNNNNNNNNDFQITHSVKQCTTRQPTNYHDTTHPNPTNHGGYLSRL